MPKRGKEKKSKAKQALDGFGNNIGTTTGFVRIMYRNVGKVTMFICINYYITQYIV